MTVKKDRSFDKNSKCFANRKTFCKLCAKANSQYFILWKPVSIIVYISTWDQ